MSAVSVRKWALVWRRSRIPEIKSAANDQRNCKAAIQPRCDRRGTGWTIDGCGSCPGTEICLTVCDCIGIIPSNSFQRVLSVCTPVPHVHAAIRADAETVGTKSSVDTVAKSSPPMTARPESVLFATIPQPKSHGQHADVMARSGHQNGAEARETGFKQRL